MPTIPTLRSKLAGYLEDKDTYARYNSKWSTVSDLGVQTCQIALNTELFGAVAAEGCVETIPDTVGDLRCAR